MSQEIKECPQRFEPATSYNPQSDEFRGVMEENHMGDYVLYSDYEALRRAAESLQSVLGDAPAKALTADKTRTIIKRDGSQITGFVVTGKYGNICIIDKSAVRWLSKDEHWWLMHDSKSPIDAEKGRA